MTFDCETTRDPLGGPQPQGAVAVPGSRVLDGSADPDELSPGSETLQLIAEGVTQVAGWGVAAISVARRDGYLQVVAVAGNDDASRKLHGARTPIAEMMTKLDKADDWGHLKFVPHQRVDLDGEFFWVPDLTPVAADDAWHPMDLLVAPLLDAAGALRGILSIDLPVGGRRPDPEQRRVLNLYAEQAGRAVLTALEREALAEQLRILRATRRIVARASRHSSVQRMLAECRSAMVEGFQARGSWVQTFGVAGREAAAVHAADGRPVRLPAHLTRIAEQAAIRMQTSGEPGILVRHHPVAGALTPTERRVVDAAMDQLGVHSVLFVPLCAAGECLGSLVLVRGRQDARWSDAEQSAAAQIGRDLGQALLSSRNIARQRRLVRELTELDSYRSQLIATVSHELKSPLTAILGHLELLDTLDVPAPARACVTSMDRAARRLARVADDLLLLSRVGDPSTPMVRVPVDLVRIVHDALDVHRVTADKRDIALILDDPGVPVLTAGDPHQLDRVVVNLVSNAVKYSPDGRRVSLSLGVDPDAGEVSLTCTDEGIGISAADRAELFTEFFRSDDPAAATQPGTGLGLAIAARIVDRHRGRIEVESELGVGSLFRVVLPSAPGGSTA